MNILDLHGIKHKDAPNKIDTFIRYNKNNLPIEIITGNSLDMQGILKKVVNIYNLNMKPKSFMNLGSYIINDN